MQTACHRGRGLLVVGLAALLAAAHVAGAGDWPQWRYDAGHGGISPETLPGNLHLQWMLELPAPTPAWPASQPWLRFDVSYTPVAAGGRLFVPSMRSDSLTAYELASGRQLWRFYADGPVRLAPVVHAGRVYFVSDDGRLYCLDAEKGTLVWRVQGGPGERRVLGCERLISTWPAHGAPVLADDTLYFTAGIWPFMGIFVRAVDAATGQIRWTNSGEGAAYTMQPHHSEAFSGFVPRGMLSVAGDALVVSGGRTQPGVYDRRTGRLRFFDFGAKNTGTWQATARDPWFFNGTQMSTLADGKLVLDTPATLHDEHGVYSLAGDRLVAQTLLPVEKTVEVAAKPTVGAARAAADDDEEKSAKSKRSSSKSKTDEKEKKADTKEKSPVKKEEQGAAPQDKNSNALTPNPSPASGRGEQKNTIKLGPIEVPIPKIKVRQKVLEDQWRATLPSGVPQRLFLKAGKQFALAGPGEVVLVELDAAHKQARVVWREKFDGEPWDVLAADGRLIVVTTAGRIYCYGAKPVAAEQVRRAASASEPSSPEADRTAKALLQQSGINEGYALWVGLKRPDMLAGLVRQSQLHVVALDPDVARIDAIRRQFDAQELYGPRVAAHEGSLAEFHLPPYFASLAVVDQLPAAPNAALLEAVFQTLRPQGGVAIFLGANAATLAPLCNTVTGQGATLQPCPLGVKLVRGDLPGAGQWTHQYGNAANTVVSADRLVRAPLGLLWFGGPSHDDVLPRHGHGPAPQVAAGRLLIEGPNMLRAIDIYTGRLLWQKTLPGLGRHFDTILHRPGANATGSNYVTQADRVYVAHGDKVLVLDAASGKERPPIAPPAGPTGEDSFVGFLAVLDNVLLFGSGPQQYSSASARLYAYDRHSGKLLWQRTARYEFRHNAICACAGRVFLIDKLAPANAEKAKRRGEDPSSTAPQHEPLLAALDLVSGRELWSTRKDVFGTFLSCSAEYGVLLQSGSASRDRAPDEVKEGLVAYQAADGKVLWQDLARRYAGPCMLHHDTIITQNEAFALRTGEPKRVPDPLTGVEIPWKFQRNYGCNTVIASEHLLTFRSAAAGFFDLCADGGTGNLGGFKSGCTSNLIVAGGLLCAPEYTRTCTCRYQNQTSLALVHDPQAELWTFSGRTWNGQRVLRAGINFGAPGDRRAADGTLWMDFPSTGGPSPNLPISVLPRDGARLVYFCRHASEIRVPDDRPGLAWVAASGVENVGQIVLTLAKNPDEPPRRYRVRLHFVEQESLPPGQRAFRVAVQGQPLEASVDVAQEVGPMTALVREVKSVEAGETLTVTFAAEGSATRGPVCAGLEVHVEEP